MSKLFTPLSLRGITLANRIVISPMCQYSADNGSATDWHMIHLGSLALSGAGMLCLEATAVEPDGRISPDDLGLWDDERERALAPVLAAIRRHSGIAVTVQLAHAGRKASVASPWHGGGQVDPSEGGWIPWAPSPAPFAETDVTPRALDEAGLARVRDAFAAAAARAARLGLDGIELHAAHGYLLHQFLSPLANLRSDRYGGSLENRMRFPLEVFDAVRAAFPADHPVGVRVSATDWVAGGWDIEQTVAFARELGHRGVDWIDVSSGGLSRHQKISAAPGYQVPFAQRVKQETGATVMAVGLITDAAQAEAILQEGRADLVALGRAMLYEPHWPWHAAVQLEAAVDAPPQYWRAAPQHRGLFRMPGR
jgi:2,4-dienoyl-CoA reductase-like NADH-dependent reductase (Old Yellow Enzyme family)